jgi:hypothetical protein
MEWTVLMILIIEMADFDQIQKTIIRLDEIEGLQFTKLDNSKSDDSDVVGDSTSIIDIYTKSGTQITIGNPEWSFKASTIINGKVKEFSDVESLEIEIQSVLSKLNDALTIYPNRPESADETEVK